MTTITRASFYDVAEALNIPPMALLDKEMDRHVQPYLYAMGIDTNKQVLVQACQHRAKKFGTKPVVGFTYLGFGRTDKEWLHDPRCTLEARIDACGDPFLKADMMILSAQSPAVDLSGKGRKDYNVLPTEVEENESDVLKQIEELVELQRIVRNDVVHDTEGMDGL